MIPFKALDKTLRLFLGHFYMIVLKVARERS